MALTFAEDLDVPPIPFDTARTAWQATALAGQMAEAGGFDALAEQSTAVILTADAQAPGELNRLRRLYREVYTPAEVRRLVENGLRQAGLRRTV